MKLSDILLLYKWWSSLLELFSLLQTAADFILSKYLSLKFRRNKLSLFIKGWELQYQRIEKGQRLAACDDVQSLGVRMTEQDLAAIKIQTKYRQYRAKMQVNAVRQERAAIKIQAGYHGYVARKLVREMRYDDQICDNLK